MLAALAILADDHRRLAAEAANKLTSGDLYVAVIGEFKRGKTTLINALLGDSLLPTGVIPVTAVATLVRFGAQPKATVRLVDGSEIDIAIGAIADYVTEQENPGNAKGIREVVVEHPGALLQERLILVDTPGIGSIHRHNTEAAAAFLPRVDVALLVLTVDAPLSQSEALLLGEVAESAASVAVCLNKVDLLTPTEVSEAVAFVCPRVAALCGGPDPVVFAISAREAIARRDGGVSSLTSWLTKDIAQRRAELVSQHARHLAATLLSVAGATVQLEIAAASKPAGEAQAARRAFDEARADLASGAEEEAAILVAACRRATETVIEPRVEELRDVLPGVLLSGSDEESADRIAAEATRWRDEIGAALTAAISAPLDRHSLRLHDQVARFVEKAGQAFGITLPHVLDLRRHINIPPVRLDFVDEPGALAMGIRQLRRRAPGGVGRRWRQHAREDRAVEEADRIAGRLRFAAVEAAERATQDWLREAAVAWQPVSQALAAAVARSERAAVANPSCPSSELDCLRARLETARLALEGGRDVA